MRAVRTMGESPCPNYRTSQKGNPMKYDSVDIETAPRRLALRIVRELANRDRRHKRKLRISAKRSFLDM
jgi:hypothetical protein